MMSNNDRCFVCGWTGHFGCYCSDAQCYSCDEFGHFAQDCPNKIIPSGMPGHLDRSCSRPQYTHTQRDRSHSIHYRHRYGKHFNWSVTPLLWLQQEQQQLQKAHITVPIQPSQQLMPPFGQWMLPLPLIPWHIVRHSNAPSQTHHFSHWFHWCHYYTDHSQSPFSNSHHTAHGPQPSKKAKPLLRPSTPLKSHGSKTYHPVLLIRFFLRFRQQLWFFKLLDPSASSDEDEQGGKSSIKHYAIGLVSDFPKVTVHIGKRFKALINSGAAISLAYTCVYNMIKDHYQIRILSAAVHLKMADTSLVSSLGKATLHLCNANSKFSHTSIICDKLPGTDILLGIDIQKRYPLSYCWDSDKQSFTQRQSSFLTCTRNQAAT